MLGEMAPKGSSSKTSMRESAGEEGAKKDGENFLAKSAPPAAAEGCRNSRRRSISGQPRADAVAQRFAVDGFSFQRGFGGFYHRAHLLDGGGAGFTDRFIDGTVHFDFPGPPRQIPFDSIQLLPFLFHP